MLWYLVRPFTGTSDPPALSRTHPIRSFFTKYGLNATRHPIIILLVWVAVATTFIYPSFFLFTLGSIINGASNLPRHVWTSAEPFKGPADTRPDVVLRSIWIHGSYMKALEPEILQRGLEVQDVLLGPTTNFNPRRMAGDSTPYDPFSELTVDQRDAIHASNGLTNSSWLFHSPLQYWSCSMDKIKKETDIIQTVNDHSHDSTSVNVTLRHSIVFSGKRFEDRRLVAADALVITLVHMLDSPVGRQWERRAEELALRSQGQWDIYPNGGRSVVTTLYEFRFQAPSWLDDLLFLVIYICIFCYYSFFLWKLSALKSRVGLIGAVVTQLVMAILSSFTICAIVKIDLSKIPGALYPLVFWLIGLNNIFSLINAVMGEPSESPQDVRVGEALGRVGHVLVANVGFNLFLCLLLSRLAFVEVSPFCTFAAIAILFDFFYLLTFFVAVLGIDVRRTELSDMELASSKRRRSYTPAKKSWLSSFLDAEGPHYTRTAGSIFMVCMFLIVQWHCAPLVQTLSRFWYDADLKVSTSLAQALGNINQAREPTAWLQMQDHETAREIINVVKPHGSAYLARVYEPLVFVLDGSNRTATDQGVRTFLPAAYDFVRNQWRSFIVTIVFAAAAVALLMTYLLHDGTTKEERELREEEALLNVQTLEKGHALDIMLIDTSPNGLLATVGLDRRICIWDVKNGNRYYVRDTQQIINPFPVLAIALSRDGKLLAILSGKNKVHLWKIPEQSWDLSMEVQMNSRVPLCFSFGHSDKTLPQDTKDSDKESDDIDPLVIVRQNGLMTEVHMQREVTRDLPICRSPLVCVKVHMEKPTKATPNPPLRLLTSSKKGCVHVASKLEQGWVSEGLEALDAPGEKDILSVLSLPILGSFLAVRQQTVDLVDLVSNKITHTFATKSMKPGTLRCFHSTRRRPQCGSVGLGNLALAYTCEETGNVIMQLYLPRREGDTICFRDPAKPGSKTCCLWTETLEKRFEVENPGVWDALNSNYLVGVRKLEPPAPKIKPKNPNIRRRIEEPYKRPVPVRRTTEEELWEVWSISARGLIATSPLFGPNEGGDLLLANDCSLRPMGRQSVAVTIGNVVKVVTVGHETFDGDESAMDDPTYVGMTQSISRRKKGAVLQRKKVN